MGLRRAIAYADDNADRDITTADMAAVAGVRPRALQYAFRRYRDTTPLQYLRQVRLQRAHRDLQAADPNRTTVAAVAARWGFTNPGRFSTDYRTAYGRVVVGERAKATLNLLGVVMAGPAAWGNSVHHGRCTLRPSFGGRRPVMVARDRSARLADRPGHADGRKLLLLRRAVQLPYSGATSGYER